MDVVQVMASSREGLELYGFDLTPDMVEVARRRLGDRIPQENLHQGDVLSDSAYEFDGAPGSYQLIYAFDVVQQLPRSRQLEAVRAMLKHLDEGGCAVVFDHDRWSPYGLRMGLRKLVTKYLRVPLVPRYYCNARYPALSRFASRLAASGAYSTDVRVAPDGKKRALLVWHRGGPSDAVS